MSWIEKPKFSVFDTFNLTELKIDEAWLRIRNVATQNLWLYELSSNCFECPYRLVGDGSSVQPNSSLQLRVPTKFPMKYRFRTSGFPVHVLENINDRNAFCDTDFHFGEFGVYDLTAAGPDPKMCFMNTLVDPVNVYLPILVILLIYTALACCIMLWNIYGPTICSWIKMLLKVTSVESSTSVRSANSNGKNKSNAPPAKRRLQSLDTFRGLCIIIMIFVNDGGAQYYFTEHATWDGLYIADLVFPWFLWIMGVCIPVSIKSQIKRKTPKLTILKHILIRSLKLIGIGLILASKRGPIDIQQFRLPGVLQRFGICYFVSAASVLLCADDALVENRVSQNKLVSKIQDVVFLWKGWLVSLSILAVHTILTFTLKVPGCPTGYLGPGGLHKGNAYPAECIGGAAGYIDRQILTLNHMFKFPTALDTYKTGPFDPEGIFGTLTSIFQVWLGVQAGLTLQVYQKHSSRLWRWAIWATITGAIGAALCGAKQTGGVIPVNKNLWSLSYVMVTTSFALILLIGLYIIIDLRPKKFWTGTPFLEPGMNSILLYIGHSVCFVMLPFHFDYKNEIGKTHFLRLIESLWGTSLWVFLAIRLHKRNFFWSL